MSVGGASLTIAIKPIAGASGALTAVGRVSIVVGLVALCFCLPALRALDWRGRPMNGAPEDAVQSRQPY
jgi:hypothetical protein